MDGRIPLDKTILSKWLAAGYTEDNRLYPSRKGTPQGGIISPTLSNMVLDGLERVVHAAVPRRSRVNFVRYADDFIVTGKSRRMLRKRHPNKSKRWLFRRYWRDDGTRHWFGVTCKLKKVTRRYEIVRLGALGIKRYVKIRADANPYLPEFGAYF